MNKKKELGGSLFFACLGVALFIGSYFVNRLAGSKIGPEFLPRVVGVLLVIMSISVFIGALKMPADAKKVKTEKKEKRNLEQTILQYRDLITAAFVLLYVFVLEEVGFEIATSIYLFAQMTLFRPLDKKTLLGNAVIAVVTVVVIYFVFVEGLNLMLPSSGLF